MLFIKSTQFDVWLPGSILHVCRMPKLLSAIFLVTVHILLNGTVFLPLQETKRIGANQSSWEHYQICFVSLKMLFKFAHSLLCGKGLYISHAESYQTQHSGNVL